MAILSPISEVFGVFVADMKASSREDAARSLERADGEIYLRIDRKRFRLIRKDERTVLTTLGAVTFRRRYYFDWMLGSYVHPLDVALGLPGYSRYSNELRVKALELAADLTYELSFLGRPPFSFLLRVPAPAHPHGQASLREPLLRLGLCRPFIDQVIVGPRVGVALPVDRVPARHELVVVPVPRAVSVGVLGVVEVLHRRADADPPPLQLLGACVDQDAPVYPAVPAEVRFAPDLAAVLQDPENRLDGPLADVELLGEPGDLHRPARVVDDVMLDYQPPLGRGRLAELDELLPIFAFGLEKDVARLRLLDPGALLPRIGRILPIVDDVLVDVLLLYHASNYRVGRNALPLREVKQKRLSNSLPFRNRPTFGEKMGRKTRFFGEKRRLIFLIFRLEKGKKKSDPI